MRLIIILLFVGGFLGPYAYLGFEKIHLIRILPIFMVAVYFIYNVRLMRQAAFLITYFILFILYTAVISIYHIENLRLNDVYNLIVLLFFILSIILTIQYNSLLFLNLLKKTCYLFVIVSVPIMFYELATENHLSHSGMADPSRHDFTYFHLPTVFYTNSNDFAFVFVLVVMLILYLEKKTIVIYSLTIISLVMIYLTESRLSFLIFLIYLFFYFDFLKPRTILMLLAIFLSVGVIVVISNDFSFNKLFNFSFEAGGSLYRRYHLYLEGIKSVQYNFGTGFGVGGYHYYYTSVVEDTTAISTDSDPHNFLIELLINSGIYFTLAYILINAFILIDMYRSKVERLVPLMFILYFGLLLSSSSSLFLWPHYFFYFFYVLYYKSDFKNLKQKQVKVNAA